MYVFCLRRNIQQYAPRKWFCIAQLFNYNFSSTENNDNNISIMLQLSLRERVREARVTNTFAPTRDPSMGRVGANMLD